MKKSAKHVVELAGSRRSRGGGVRAFTLTELLLAVGALALLSVAVAQVFSLTSKTVQAGRRQSAVNTKAAAVERQLRADLSSITREGFLVIRNQWTTFIADPNNPNPLADLPGPAPLVAGDPAPRPRRIDELLFFSKGNFVSKREPVVSGEVVRSDAAMIYYGHGSGQLPGVDGRDPTAPVGSGWNTPVNLADPNPISDASALPVAPPHGFQTPFSPQRYASDWVLARREVLLTPPSNQIRSAGTSGINPAFVQDGPGQIGMQPAMDSVVNASAFAFAPPTSFAGFAVQPGARSLSSGAVDIAGTTLAEIRSQVLQIDTSSGFGGFGSPALDPRRLRINVPQTGAGFFLSQELTTMQNRMNSALPAAWFGYSRMRVEPVAPNLLGWGWTAGGRAPTDRSTELERADQLMVSSGAFVPGCSEFIVEWSFGLENVAEPSIKTVFDKYLGNSTRPARAARTAGPAAAPVNSVYWHGLRRDVRDLSNNLVARTLPYRDYYTFDQPGNPLTAATPNPYFAGLRDGYYYAQPVRLRNGQLRDVPHVVKPEVVESLEQFNFGDPSATPSLYLATFGYIDPTWKPETRQNYGNGRPVLSVDKNGNDRYDANDGDVLAVELLRDVNGNGRYDADDGDVIKLNEPETMPWAWPRMIRVTFSIADPGNEGQAAAEQTFQVIVNLPADQPSASY